MADWGNSEFSEAVACALGLAMPRRAEEGGEFLVLPNGYRVQPLDSLRRRPARTQQALSLQTLASFIEYVNRFREPSTVIFADSLKGSVCAIIDYDQPDLPAWRDHRVTYAAVKSPEWQRWTEHNGRTMSQLVFAEFIEDNLPDVVDPPGAEMLEISRTLEATKKVSFASSVRLLSGDSELAYQEDIKGTASKGRLQIPERFTLGLAPYLGMPGYQMDARLRYRISDEGKLALWYDLYRPHKVLEAAFVEIVDAIREATSIRPLL